MLVPRQQVNLRQINYMVLNNLYFAGLVCELVGLVRCSQSTVMLASFRELWLWSAVYTLYCDKNRFTRYTVTRIGLHAILWQEYVYTLYCDKNSLHAILWQEYVYTLYCDKNRFTRYTVTRIGLHAILWQEYVYTLYCDKNRFTRYTVTRIGLHAILWQE